MKNLCAACLISLIGITVNLTFAQQCKKSCPVASEDNSQKALSASEATLPENSPFKIKDYGGSFWDRAYLLGDLDGKRTDLALQGITFETDITQVFQGNTRGGKNTSGAWGYSGSADYWLRFDTQRLGLWPAGMITIHGETAFGNSPYGSVAAIMPINTDVLFPEKDEPGLTTLSELYLTQFLSEQFAVMIGKIDPITLADENEFADNEKTQFLSAAFKGNPVLGLYAPYTALTVAMCYFPDKETRISTFAIDANGGVTRSGFDTAFSSPRGTSVGVEFTKTVHLLGQEGHQRIGYAYSNKHFTALDQNWLVTIPTGTIKKQSGDGGIWYNFDQYIYSEEEDPTQGVGIFGRFGYTDGSANPIQRFYSFGVGGKGVIDERDNDTFGIGYYYVELSDDLPAALNLGSEQGVEMYYNIEISKAIHFTPDIQWIVDPTAGYQNRDNAIIVGGRLQMSF